MGETAIRLLPGARHGLVSVAARRLRQTPRSIARHARQQMRSMSTLIVSVCDDEVLQKKLPQFLFYHRIIVGGALLASRVPFARQRERDLLFCRATCGSVPFSSVPMRLVVHRVRIFF